MNRRCIFKTISSAICAAAIEVFGVEPQMQKVEQEAFNSMWLSAEYEDVFISQIRTNSVERGRVKFNHYTFEP